MKMKKKYRYSFNPYASFQSKLFDSILTPCKWPQIETLQFTYNPREGHLPLNILGSKWNWFYICIELYVLINKKSMIVYIGPEANS